MTNEDRREHERTASEAPVYLMWHEGDVVRQGKGRLMDVSEGGLRFQSAAKLGVGTICYAASPAHSFCSRIMICHSEPSMLSATVGARFLASF